MVASTCVSRFYAAALVLLAPFCCGVLTAQGAAVVAAPAPAISPLLFVGEQLPAGGVQLKFAAGDPIAASLGKNLSYSLGGEVPSSLTISNSGLLTGTFGKTPTGVQSFTVNITDTDAKKSYSSSFTVDIEEAHPLALANGANNLTVLSGANATILASLPAGAAAPTLSAVELSDWGFTASYSGGVYTFQSSGAKQNGAAPGFSESIGYSTPGGAQTASLNLTVALSETADLAPLKPSSVPAAQSSEPTKPVFLETPSSDNQTMIIDGASGATVSVFQFKGTLDTSDKDKDCGSYVKKSEGVILPITASGTNSSSTYSIKLGDTAPFTIILVNPPLAGSQLCIEQTAAASVGGAAPPPVYSELVSVSDANNPYAHVRTFYTAGAMINNESGSIGSSTGAEYVDVGLAFSMLPPVSGKWNWNWTSSVSGRFSSIPVTAPSGTSTTGTTTTASSGTLNILSSQESVRVLGATALTVGDGQKINGYQIFSGPVIKAGIDTLLNPSATAGSGASGSTTAVAQFAPVYTEFSGGWRMGLRHYNSSEDSSPQTVAQMDITIGKFSNLQSLVCNPAVTLTTATQPANTSCYTPQTQGASSYAIEQQNRITLLRPEIGGFINLGSSNFVLGLDANLPQSVDAPRELDVQNKAGGSVIIYFGYSGSLTGLFNSLKLSSASH